MTPLSGRGCVGDLRDEVAVVLQTVVWITQLVFLPSPIAATSRCSYQARTCSLSECNRLACVGKPSFRDVGHRLGACAIGVASDAEQCLQLGCKV